MIFLLTKLRQWQSMLAEKDLKEEKCQLHFIGSKGFIPYCIRSSPTNQSLLTVPYSQDQ